MNSVNYQPTGVYRQFSTKPVNNGGNKPSELKNTKTPEELKKQKAIKIGVGTLVTVGVAVLAAYFLSGHSITKRAERIIKNIKEGLDDDSAIIRINNIRKDDSEFDALYGLYEKYKAGLYGKAASLINETREFFKKNFYNY